MSLTCPGDSVSFGGRCYKGKFDDRLTFSDAQEVCQNMGGNIMSVNSYGEQILLTDMASFGSFDIGKDFDVWVGKLCCI